MARLVTNDNITSGRSLTFGQTQQLNGFTIGLFTAIKPTTPPTTVKYHCIGLEYSEKMDPADVWSLNELLDCIAALGVSIDYDWIRLKPDEREVNRPPITHPVAVVVERAQDTSPPMLRTKYVRVSEPLKPDTLPLDGTPRPPNYGSDVG